MKRHRTTSSDLLLYISFHVLLVLLALVLCLTSPRTISSNFMDVIPSNGISKGMLEAENAFTAGQDRSLNFFVGSASFEEARAAASRLCRELEDTALFESVELESSAIDTGAFSSFIGDNYRFLLDGPTIRRIRQDPVSFQQDSLAAIFGAFTFSSVSDLDRDPFLLSESIWQNYIGKASSLTGLSPKDGVLASQVDGLWYVMFSAVLSEDSISLTDSKTIDRVFSICDSLENDLGVEVASSGLALHSMESASNSQKEILVVSIVSVAAIMVLFLASFRNLHVIRLFLTSLFISLASAICTLLVFFRDIHVMTLIFGTSLIGSCIDYSIHFYTRYCRRGKTEGALEVRRSLLKSLTIGFSSTALCYLLLLFSGYPILKQIALFSTGGLLSSYLTALLLYPKLITPSMVNGSSYVSKPDTPVRMPSWLGYALAGAATLFFVLSLGKLEIHNDISSLYTPSARLMEYESTGSKVLGYSSTTYAIVEGSSSGEVLEKVHAFTSRLEDLMSDGLLDSYVSSSLFIPTEQMQRESLEAFRTLSPLLEEQCLVLGIDEASQRAVEDKLEDETFITLENLPEGIYSLLSNVSLGRIGDRYYEVVILKNAVDGSAVREAAENLEGIQYFQTSTDVSLQLDELTRMICIIFALSFIAMAVLLCIVYGIKKGLGMSLAPYTVILSTISASSVLGLSIDFFYAVGLVLVVGLGLDYIVFAMEKDKGSFKAILLSFLTTELSFGTLAFSSFKPVHIFGLTVFIGILVAFICAFSARKGGEK